MQLEGSEFDFTDLFYDQLLPQFTDVGPGYDPSQSDFFGPFALRFIEIIKGYFEDLDSDDIDRIIRQGQVSEFISVLRRFENGDATLDDLKAVDVSDLTEMPGWSDYYSGIIGEGTGDTEDTEDTEEQDPNLRELIEKYGQQAVEDAQGKLKELEAVFNKTIDDPFGTLEGIIKKTASASSGSTCAGSDLPEWVRECVTVGVGIGLPFPLPGPLGTIFKGATVGEIEEAIKEAGHDIGKVLSGETSIEEVMGKIVDGVVDKVRGIFTDKDEVSIDDVLGTIGDILVGGGYVLAGGIYDEYFKDKVNSTIGVPIIPFTSSQECQDSERYTADEDGNCGECIDPNKIYDAAQGKCVEPEIVDPNGDTTKCTEGTEDENGNCICGDGSLEDENGKCGPDVTQVECPEGTDKVGQMVNDISECSNNVVVNPEKEWESDYCKTRGPEGGTLVTIYTDGTQEESFSEVCYKEASTPPSTKEWESDYCKTRGPEGGTLVTIYTDGSQEESFSENCYKAADSTPSEGSDGCEGGKVRNPSTDQCECPEGTVENAAGTCVPITSTPPSTPVVEEEEEEESSGGGGGGGGGGMMSSAPFNIRPIGITAQPTLAARQEFPITNYLQGMLTGNGNKLA